MEGDTLTSAPVGVGPTPVKHVFEEKTTQQKQTIFARADRRCDFRYDNGATSWLAKPFHLIGGLLSLGAMVMIILAVYWPDWVVVTPVKDAPDELQRTEHWGLWNFTYLCESDACDRIEAQPLRKQACHQTLSTLVGVTGEECYYTTGKCLCELSHAKLGFGSHDPGNCSDSSLREKYGDFKAESGEEYSDDVWRIMIGGRVCSIISGCYAGAAGFFGLYVTCRRQWKWYTTWMACSSLMGWTFGIAGIILSLQHSTLWSLGDSCGSKSRSAANRQYFDEGSWGWGKCAWLMLASIIVQFILMFVGAVASLLVWRSQAKFEDVESRKVLGADVEEATPPLRNDDFLEGMERLKRMPRNSITLIPDAPGRH